MACGTGFGKALLMHLLYDGCNGVGYVTGSWNDQTIHRRTEPWKNSGLHWDSLPRFSLLLGFSSNGSQVNELVRV